jgi:hypothetical protein
MAIAGGNRVAMVDPTTAAAPTEIPAPLGATSGDPFALASLTAFRIAADALGSPQIRL